MDQTTTMQRIEIFDVDDTGVLAPELRDILKLIESHDDRRWFLLDLEATGELRGGDTILQLEQRIAREPHGLAIDWRELTDLAAQITQTINCILAGCQTNAPPPMLPLNPYDGLEIVVEAIDSSLWSVSTNDRGLIQRLQAAFKKTKVTTWTN